MVTGDERHCLCEGYPGASDKGGVAMHEPALGSATWRGSGVVRKEKKLLTPN
jgi:hypothetical protein